MTYMYLVLEFVALGTMGSLMNKRIDSGVGPLPKKIGESMIAYANY
jgi:hypothetical protein